MVIRTCFGHAYSAALLRPFVPQGSTRPHGRRHHGARPIFLKDGREFPRILWGKPYNAHAFGASLLHGAVTTTLALTMPGEIRSHYSGQTNE